MKFYNEQTNTEIGIGEAVFRTLKQDGEYPNSERVQRAIGNLVEMTYFNRMLSKEQVKDFIDPRYKELP